MRRKMDNKFSTVISNSFYPVWSLFETGVTFNGNSATCKIMSTIRLSCVIRHNNIRTYTYIYIYREYLKQGCCKEENRWWPQRRVCVPRSHSSQPSLVCSKTCLQLQVLHWRRRIRRKVRRRSYPFLESLKMLLCFKKWNKHMYVCEDDGYKEANGQFVWLDLFGLFFD